MSHPVTLSEPDAPFLSFSDGKVLSAEQKRFYHQNGYVVLKNVVPLEKLKKYERRFNDIVNNKVQKSDGLVVMKDVSRRTASGENAVNKIQDFQHDDHLFDYCTTPEIVATVQDIIGPNLMAMHTMLINKPPDLVCSWTAMEKVHKGNGCLVVVPGSHRNPGRLLPHGYPDWKGGVNAMYHGIMDYDVDSIKDKLFYAEMEAGDTIFFHPLLIHGSGANKTKGYRKAISCHYASADKCYYIDVRGTSQDSIRQEVEVVVKKRLGPDAEVSYEDVWKMKGRLVSGTRSNL